MKYSRMLATNLGKMAFYHAREAYLDYLSTADTKGISENDFLKLVLADDSMNIDFKWDED